ncbi:MAG: DUF3189 family protein [Bacillota bacterium]|nr:DUF3189 family protein [Bacillota bacterium]
MIKVIYHCYGGSHSSVTTAGIHLGLLPWDRIPNASEILQVPHFDGNEPIAHGHFRLIGYDYAGNEVYVLGKRTLGRNVTCLLQKVAQIIGCSHALYPVDTTAPVNLLMIFGGFLSRGLKLAPLGRPLVILGTQLAYFRFVQLADQVEENLRKRNKEQLSSLEQIPTPRVVFYICPQDFRLALLTAGFHLYSEAPDDFVLEWALEQKQFSGEIGTISYLGSHEGHDLYLVGAAGEPQIVARTLRELRNLLRVSRADWYVVESHLTPSLFYRGVALFFKLLGWRKAIRFFEKRVFRKLIHACRHEGYRVKASLKDGVLDET